MAKPLSAIVLQARYVLAVAFFYLIPLILTNMGVKKEGQSINQLGWLYWNPDKMPVGSTSAGQFGVGKSLSATPGTWAGGYGTESWCEYMPSLCLLLNI